MSMVGELTTTIDLEAVDRGELDRFPVHPDRGIVATMRSAGIIAYTADGQEGGSEQEFIVEIEFEPEEYSLDEQSFDRYLDTFEGAEVTQEAMTVKLHEDLKSALDLDNLFVEVHRMQPTEKRTHIGRP
jgi:hypothetical protein